MKADLDRATRSLWQLGGSGIEAAIEEAEHIQGMDEEAAQREAKVMLDGADGIGGLEGRLRRVLGRALMAPRDNAR